MKKEKFKNSIIERLKQTPIVQIACKKIGISRATYYRWRKQDKEFAKAADLAILAGTLLVNDMAESQLLAAIRDQKLGAIVFWLKYHHKSYATKVEVTARLKEPDDELNPKQKAVIKKALKLAALSRSVPKLLINKKNKKHDKRNSKR